jgi:hypothetical protein
MTKQHAIPMNEVTDDFVRCWLHILVLLVKLESKTSSVKLSKKL